MRLLEIDCAFTDDYLVGHARRVGLAGPETPVAAMEKLLPTIRHDVKFESDRLRELDLAGRFTCARARAGRRMPRRWRAFWTSRWTPRARSPQPTIYSWIE